MTEHPIQRLKVSSIGAFSEVDLSLAPRLNVVVGENGAGKSHLLKLAYSATSVLHAGDPLSDAPRAKGFGTALAEKLVGVFRPERLGRLTNRRRGQVRGELDVTWTGMEQGLSCSFSSRSSTEIQIDSVPERWVGATPAFIPTRELLSLYPGLVALYEQRVVEFDETWRDTAVLLGGPLQRGPREERARSILVPIEEALGGKVVEEGGRFYLRQEGIGTLEMHLVAEGLRKLAMLARLVANGTLVDSGYLFWDEPETNLNPRTIRAVARTVVELSRAGVQVFVATHSLFLLREITIVLGDPSNADVAAGSGFIGLHRGPDGVRAEAGPTLADIGDITALDEEITQTSRYLDSELAAAER